MSRKHRLPFLRDRLLRLVHLIVLTPLALVVVSCGGDDGSSAPVGNSLIAIEIGPANPSIPKGEGLQFKATGIYGDSRTADLTASVSWVSSAPAVATPRPDGFVVGESEGTTAISATFAGAVLVSGSTTLTVTPARLLSISVTPDPAYSGVGMALQMKATGRYSDRTTADVTARASWTSGTPSVATIGATSGMTTGVALGSSTITASIGSVAATTPLSIVSGVWVPSGTSNRTMDSAAVLLANGRVLFPGALQDAETEAARLYEPLGDEWSQTGRLAQPRSGYSATLLANGTVLVAGGYNTTIVGFERANAELYEPASGTWSVTGSLSGRRISHTATLLPNGKVLVAGGHDGTSGIPLASAELYDPVSGTWSATGRLSEGRVRHTATLLPNGKVLVAGGNDSFASAELYDPVSGTWSATGSLSGGRRWSHTATLLPNGKVLVAGGCGTSVGYPPSCDLASAELYDPASGTWSVTGSLLNARRTHSATLLPSGKALVAGGESTAGVLASAELYDPAEGTWSATGSLRNARYGHPATLLPNGKVLVGGACAELYW